MHLLWRSRLLRSVCGLYKPHNDVTSKGHAQNFPLDKIDVNRQLPDKGWIHRIRNEHKMDTYRHEQIKLFFVHYLSVGSV